MASTWPTLAFEERLSEANEPFLIEGADQIGADFPLGRSIKLTRYPRFWFTQDDKESIDAIRHDRIHGEIQKAASTKQSHDCREARRRKGPGVDIHEVGDGKTAEGQLVGLFGIVLKIHVFGARGCREGSLARLERMQRDSIEILAERVLATIFEVGLDHLACRAQWLEQIEAEALVRNGQSQQSARAEELMRGAQKRNRIW